MYINCILTIVTDWLGVAVSFAAFIGGIIISPVIVNVWKERKIPREKRLLMERQKRELEVLPFLKIYTPCIQSSSVTVIKLKNIGGKANGLSVVTAFMNLSIEKLFLDKNELEINESCSITLVGNLILPTEVPIKIGISYTDIDGMRYQQTYLRENRRESLTEPTKLINRNN
jgi:hypothetical protein